MGSGNDPWLTADPWSRTKEQPVTPPPSDSEGPSGTSPRVSFLEQEDEDLKDLTSKATPKPGVSGAPDVPKPKFPPATEANSSGQSFSAASPLVQVPESGFSNAMGPGLDAKPQKHKTFHIQVYKDTPDDKLGIRTEIVDGIGFGAAGRIHRIFEGGLIQRWNRMAETCGMNSWQVEIDDVIIGVNGRMEFDPNDLEVRTATDLDLLILRGLPARKS